MTKLLDISDYQEKRAKLSSQHGRAAQSDLPLTKQEPAPKKGAKGGSKGKAKESEKNVPAQEPAAS